MKRGEGKRHLQDRLNAASARLRAIRSGMSGETVEAVLALLRRAGWSIDSDRQMARIALDGADAVMDDWRPELSTTGHGNSAVAGIKQ